VQQVPGTQLKGFSQMCQFRQLHDIVGFLLEKTVAYVCYRDMETGCSASDSNTKPQQMCQIEKMHPERHHLV